jgi:outer membrane protein assembly factor BamB
VIGYFFALPALTPNSISGSFLDAVIVPTKSGEQRVWVLTDGSFNFIQTTKSPGRTSTGRECYFCKTWTYIIDPKDKSVEKKIKTEYEDIITTIEMYYDDGKVWTFTREYGENEPKIEAFDAETGEKVMETKDFVAKFKELSAGLTEVHYDADDKCVNIKTKDGREGVYGLESGKLYKNTSDFRKSWEKDSAETVIGILAPEDNSSSPRKKLYKATGPKAVINDNMSSLTSYIGKEDHPFLKNKVKSEMVSDKVFLEGIMYHTDDDCAIIIHLDKLGKKSNRLITCFDLKTGKEKWTIQPDDMFDEMKIDEEDDTFSSLFFTKSNIDVKRRGGLVLLQLKNEGIIGYDYETGKKLWEMDI